jgi:hypothetical protein
MGEATREAREKVVEARDALGREVDELGSAARSSFDIPAKVRRNPVQTAGLAAGVAFLAAGGPKRILRGVERRLRGGKRRRPRTLLPKEIERAIDGLGGDAAEVRERLDREFARFLERERREGKLERTPTGRLLGLLEAFAIPFGAQVSRRLTERLFAADPDRAPADGSAQGDEAGGSSGTQALAEDAAAYRALQDRQQG